MYDITIIGAAIIDILAATVTPEVFQSGSQPMETIKMSFGGDALNEAVLLSRMGKHVQLISKVGDDEAGKRVLSFIKDNGLDTESMKTESDLLTGINIVLIDKEANRHFLTNPHSSLRTLTYEDIEPHLDHAAGIVSFASMFVSSLLTIPQMKRLFRKIKESGRILAVDMTKAKHGETLDDLRELLPYIDYIFPNEEEIALLTGEKDAHKNAELLLQAGVKHVLIKCGSRGCLYADEHGIFQIPAVPTTSCIDTTGAGDSFAAGFLLGLANGWPHIECAKLACAAASCTIECYSATDGIHSLDDVMRRYHISE